MKPISLTGFALCLTLSARPRRTDKSSGNPSAHYRPKPLWFWNDTRITREGIDEQMAGLRTPVRLREVSRSCLSGPAPPPNT